MNDTHPDAAKRMHELMAAKTPEERVAYGCSMFSFAKQLAMARIQQNGRLPAPLLRQRLFLHLYEDEFDEACRKKILAHLGRTVDSEGRTIA
jgi:isocitrate lyase